MDFKEMITKTCENCGENYRVDNLRRCNKYCDKCKTAVQKVTARRDAKRVKAVWDGLDEDEQLRRMELCAKKLLEKEK